MKISLWIVVFLIVCVSSGGSMTTVKQCLKEYTPKISSLGLKQLYVDQLRSYSNEPDIDSSEKKLNVILDIGLGSMWHSDVFRQMVQLNISGFDQFLRSSFNCEFESVARSDAFKFRKESIDNYRGAYVYSLGHFPLIGHDSTWYSILAHHNVLVLMNDVSDEEYFKNQFSASCRIEWHRSLQAHCFVPLPPLPQSRLNLTSEQHRLDHFTFDQVKVMLAAYRDLIRCMVPAERLFEFNLNSMPAEEYWSKLVSFLKIDVGGGAGTGGAGAGAGGGAVGVKYLSEGGTVCDSVSMRTDARHAKRVQCADEYGRTIGAIYGDRYRMFARNMLLQPIFHAPRRAPETSDRLVLGIGPGTTGTRTIHFSVNELKITSLHYQSLFSLRKNVTRLDFGYDMNVLELESPQRRVFWSDTPVPNHWWYLYKMYPNTNFMITDVRNDTAWWEKRVRDHCMRKIIVNEPSCTAPLPIRFDKSILSLEFFRMTHVRVVSLDDLHRTYDAYRALARCVIPSDNIWWVYLPELQSSEEYWTRLIELVDAKISNRQRKEFIAKGIPRCGSQGCVWNGQKYNVTYR